MKKIFVVGNSCSGKSTLSKSLSLKLGAPHIELDAIFWKEGWVQSTDEEFQTALDNVLPGDTWIIDGNYSRFQNQILKYADTVIWIDFPLRVILFRLVKRSFRRWSSKELLWGKCRETLSGSLFSKDSLLNWVISKYDEYQERYEGLFRERNDIQKFRLRTQKEVNQLIQNI